MIVTITLLLLLSAFVCTIAAAMSKCPVWVPILLVIIALLLGNLPL